MSDTVDALDEKALQAALEYLRKRPNAIHEVCRNCERQAAEIESLRARLESQTSVKMYTLLLDERDALTEKVETAQNALRCIANTPPTILNATSCSQKSLGWWIKLVSDMRRQAIEAGLAAFVEPSKAQPSEGSG